MTDHVEDRLDLHGRLNLASFHPISFYAGFSANLEGDTTVLSTQLRVGGKFFWLPVSYSLNSSGWSLSRLMPSFHPSKCELREFIGAGADLGLALPDPVPGPLANLHVSPLLTYKTFYEKFEEQRTITTFYLGGDSRIGMRILPFEINLIDVQFYYSVEERLIEIIGSPIDFGFSLPFSLTNAGALGFIPFGGKIAGKVQPLIKLELHWDEFKQWIGFDHSQTEPVIDLHTWRSLE